eukprot:6197412-Pleurochrysis_carterae.AAC.1
MIANAAAAVAATATAAAASTTTTFSPPPQQQLRSTPSKPAKHSPDFTAAANLPPRSVAVGCVGVSSYLMWRAERLAMLDDVKAAV